MKGRIPWNKGKKFPGKWRHKKKSASSKAKNSRAHLGKKASDKTKRKQSFGIWNGYWDMCIFIKEKITSLFWC